MFFFLFFLVFPCLHQLLNKYDATFCGSRESYAKSDELPYIMPLESASVGAEHYTFEKSRGVALERSEVIRPL